MVNKDLLRSVMDEILAHPEKHDQSLWAVRTDCGTAYCFAGLACDLSGMEADFTVGYVGVGTAMLVNGGTISDAAMDLLGIDYQSSEHLFAADNDTATLKHYVDQLCDTGRITPSDPWTES